MRAPHQFSDLLTGTSLFGALDATTRQSLAGDMREVRFDAGQSIF